MRRTLSLIVAVLLSLSFVFLAVGCGEDSPTKKGGLKYDEYSTDYDANIDSWKQIDPDDEDVEITWFTDYAYADKIADLVYKRTGVKVKMENAMTSNHEEINTMISGNDLPDIITIGDIGIRVQLAEEGYAYAIDKLAESYAPSMLKRISQEHFDYYSGSDGHMYGLASNFYNDKDVAEFENDLGGHQYMNYDCIVRKDYLEAYIAYKKSQDPSFDEDDLCRADNFITMCKWVKRTYDIPNSSPTVVLAPFNKTATNDCFSYAVSAVMEFFCVPMEDVYGNYLYQYDTPEFVEAMAFLNTLYNDRLVISGNFAYDRSSIHGLLQNGTPFCYIGASQQHVDYLGEREKEGYDPVTGKVAASHEYVPIVLTNNKGDAPIMVDYAGRGLYVTMVTNKCKRVDRVIKMLDYLISEQGQREVYYGQNEGEYYEYAIRPGETYIAADGTEKISTYGVIRWTDKAKDIFKENAPSAAYNAGITIETMLSSQMYKRMTSENKYGINLLRQWLEFKNKVAYFDYSISRIPLRYPIDTSDQKALNDYVDMQADIEAVWIEAVPRMIMATSEATFNSIYETALEKSYRKGAAEWTAYRNRCFKKYKEYLGIDYAWPMADPDYVAPEVGLYGSYDKYMIEKPEWINWN